MVYNYDIYYLLSPRGSQSYRVTNSAVPGIVSNGVTDWLYEGDYSIYVHTINPVILPILKRNGKFCTPILF
jgi:hypothetical protein